MKLENVGKKLDNGIEKGKSKLQDLKTTLAIRRKERLRYKANLYTALLSQEKGGNK